MDNCTCSCEAPFVLSSPYGACDLCNISCNTSTSTFDVASCSCDCKPGWTGDDCTFCRITAQSCNLAGTNSSIVAESVAQNCSCPCKDGWTGARCDVCARTHNDCGHGGSIDVNTCQCVCPSFFEGPKCDNCTLAETDCLNGCTMDSSSCSCVDHSGNFTGRFCGKMVKPTCKHGGLYNSMAGKCEGCMGSWTGIDCNTCSKSAAFCATLSDSALDTETCQCRDSTGIAVNPGCDITCRNGGVLDELNCKCKQCNGMFTGSDCSTCGITQCPTGSTLNAATCTCDNCTQPWTGPTCADCPFNSERTCPNDGQLDLENCKCIKCANGFTGPTCEDKAPCTFPPHECANGGEWDAKTCKCNCNNTLFRGARCDVCKFANSSASVCKHGGMFSASKCRCEHCEWPWTGQECNTCRQRATCHNGGVFDKTSCTCHCPGSYQGTQCGECMLSHQTCRMQDASKPTAITSNGSCICGCVKTRKCGLDEVWVASECRCKKWRLEDIPMDCLYRTQMEKAIQECLWAVDHNASHCPLSLVHEAFNQYHNCSGKCLKRPSDCGEHGMVNQTTCECQAKPCQDCGSGEVEPADVVETNPDCECKGATPCKFKLPGYSYCVPFVAGSQDCAALTENCLVPVDQKNLKQAAEAPTVASNAETVDQSFSDNFDV